MKNNHILKYKLWTDPLPFQDKEFSEIYSLGYDLPAMTDLWIFGNIGWNWGKKNMLRLTQSAIDRFDPNPL